LRREAEKHGIDGNRIGFSDKFPKETELLSKGTANLFLDTPLFNAHTTGGDVLWAGVPIVTMPGENFASRVASGLIDSTTSLPSMTIARTVEDYAQLVIQMCKSQELGNMKRALESERETAPVFDTKRLTGLWSTSLSILSHLLHSLLVCHLHVAHGGWHPLPPASILRQASVCLSVCLEFRSYLGQTSHR
jgi:predicted O-linked N-acetylglucosamine transferase (SPINDLY family)